MSAGPDVLERGQTPATDPTYAGAARGRRRLLTPVALALLAGLLVLVFATLFYGEARYRSCLQKAEAKYPAVPVSAFNTRATGPLKVSFTAERARALDRCGRF